MLEKPQEFFFFLEVMEHKRTVNILKKSTAGNTTCCEMAVSLSYCTQSGNWVLYQVTQWAMLSSAMNSFQANIKAEGWNADNSSFSSCLESLCSLFTPVINYNSTSIFLVCSGCLCGWMTKSLCRSTYLGPIDAVLSLGTRWHVSHSAYDASNTTNPIIPVKTTSFLSRSHLYFQPWPIVLYNYGEKNPQTPKLFKAASIQNLLSLFLLAVTQWPSRSCYIIVNSTVSAHFIPIKFYEKVIQCY